MVMDWTDETQVLKQLAQSRLAAFQVDASLLEKRDFLLKAAPINAYVLQRMPERFNEDMDVILAGMPNNAYVAYAATGPKLRRNIHVICAMAQHNLKALDRLPDDVKEDPFLFSKITAVNGLALKYGHREKVRAVEEVVLFAVEQNGLALQYASDELKKNEEIVTIAVKQNGLALQHADEGLKADEGIVRLALEQNGLALRYADDGLRKDKEFVRLAVQQNPKAIAYAHPDIEMDDELRGYYKAARMVSPDVLKARREQKQLVPEPLTPLTKEECDEAIAAIAEDSGAYRFLSPRYRADKDVTFAAVRSNGSMLEYASDELRADPHVVIAALTDNPLAFKHAMVRGQHWGSIDALLIELDGSRLVPKKQIDAVIINGTGITKYPRSHDGHSL